MHVNSTKIFLTIIKNIYRPTPTLLFPSGVGLKKALADVDSYPIE